ncbi:MAG TPA: hypothetical protein VE010_19250, partial [Thermoanaerobaculia bacterium]|nr:hypothetical protein [Thermoanaerobaculia bacterium]
GSQGGGNAAPSLPYNMPGEIFRDVGYRTWDGATNNWELDAAGQPTISGAGDGEFGFHDMNGNGRFDVVIRDAPSSFNSYDPGATARNEYLVKTWTVAGYGGTPCAIVPANGVPTAASCSEPHEPYLNFLYPANRTDAVRIGWEPYATQTRRPRDLIGTTVPNCVSDPTRCTSNGFDRDGALVNIPAVLNGVLYNEGGYRSTGNVDYFGSVLIRGETEAQGNAQIWFDEKLIKDNWAPPGMPRVIVYSSMTDEQ